MQRIRHLVMGRTSRSVTLDTCARVIRCAFRRWRLNVVHGNERIGDSAGFHMPPQHPRR